MKTSVLILVPAAFVLGFTAIVLPANQKARALTKAKPDGPGVVAAASPATKEARRLFLGRNCLGCHFFAGVLGRDGLDLSLSAAKYDAATLRRYIRNPKSVTPNALMPAQDKLDEASLEAMAAFLESLLSKPTNSGAGL